VNYKTDETDEIMRDLEQRRRRNEDRKRREVATATAVRKLKVDWSLFQSEIAQLDDCNHDLRRCRRILERMGLSKSEIAIVLSYLPLQGGHCDCEVVFNVDMTEPRPLVSLDCVDCGADFDEYDYIVEDAVWAASGLKPDGGLLCIGCLERRLGRRLKRDDFESKPFNEISSSKSLRLRDRLSADRKGGDQMTDDDELRQDRVVRLTDGILAVLAGADGAEADTALTLAVVASMCVGSPDAATRLRAAEGFSRQVRELIQREDIVAWIKASITWVSRAEKSQ
jgi:hypothetical protein